MPQAQCEFEHWAAPIARIHDYHLLLLPEIIRRAQQQDGIGFFLHTPWPPTELFSRLPWRADLLRGVLGANVISFHTERYRKNFVRTCGRVLEKRLSALGYI